MSAFELHVVVPSYSPSNATTNRIMAFLRGFSDCGITAHVTYVVADCRFSKVKEKFSGIDFFYLWENFPLKNRFLRQIQYEYNSRKYVRQLPKNAVVFLPWPSSRLMSALLKRADLRVFYEETELPELYRMKSFNIKTYLKSLQKLSGIFVISSALKEYFVEKGVPSEKIQIVNMIVDSTRFAHVKRENTERYIAYCGTVTSRKDGVDDLLKAYAIVNRSHPDVRLYIIGPIPGNKDDNAFLRMVNELGLKDSVNFTGFISYGKMPQVLKNAEVLALARPNNIQAKYGFPTKLGEYLLTGNPVVLTSVGDIPSFLNDKKSALIAPPNNPKLFAEKLNWVLENQEEAKIIGKEGENVAENKFNYKTEAQKIINLVTAEIML